MTTVRSQFGSNNRIVHNHFITPHPSICAGDRVGGLGVGRLGCSPLRSGVECGPPPCQPTLQTCKPEQNDGRLVGGGLLTGRGGRRGEGWACLNTVPGYGVGGAEVWWVGWAPSGNSLVCFGFSRPQRHRSHRSTTAKNAHHW